MAHTLLNTPHVDKGIRYVNFFNGRQLSAEDLEHERDATRLHQEQLGRGVGRGIIDGLHVTAIETDRGPVLQVTKGLAVNRQGQVLSVPEDVDIELQTETTARRAAAGRGEAGTMKGAQPVGIRRDDPRMIGHSHPFAAAKLDAAGLAEVFAARRGGAGPAEMLAAKRGAGLAEVLAARRDDAGLFGECTTPTPQITVKGTGIYLLTVGPASALRERAPKVGLRDDGVAARCDFAWAVEGVQFALQPLVPAGMDSVSIDTQRLIESLAKEDARTENLSRLRDLVAHAFLGTEALAAHYADLLLRQKQESPMTAYGEMDGVYRDFAHLVCDVPLAILFWTGGTVHFVDLWSVRRRLAPASLSRTWPVPTGERRAAEGEATFFHFQEQLAWLMARGGDQLDKIEARNFFRYLPPAGVLPLGSLGAGRDLSKLPFFAGRTVRRPVVIAEAAVEPLLRQSMAYPPIDLDARDDRNNLRSELVWLYEVRENQLTKTGAEPYLVFATGHMPYHGHARFDVSWFDYSNYSSLRLGSPSA